MTCTRSGARAATSWPPRWAAERRGGDKQGGANKGERKGTNQHQQQPGPWHQFGQSPVTPLHHPSSRASSQRSVSPDRNGAGDRSRSRSPSAVSESSASLASSASAADWATVQSLLTTNLTHLPAGRFVYGRRYLQPFEFSAFWHSAETNRAGARAAKCDEGPKSDEDSARTTNAAGTGTCEVAITGGEKTSSGDPGGDASFGTAARRRRNSGGGGGGGGGSFWGGVGRSDAGGWRRREDGRGAGPPTPPPPGSSSAVPVGRSPSMPVPCAKPRESHGATWPGFDASSRGRARDKTAAWKPRGRWTNERRVNEALEALPVRAGDVDDTLARTSLGSPKQARTSELTRALSQPSALASH